MGSCVKMISTVAAATAKPKPKPKPKLKLSLNHLSSFTLTDTANNGLIIRTTTLWGNLSAYGASSRVTGRRWNFNGKSKYTTSSSSICCNSLLTPDIAPTASAAYGILLLGGGLFAYTRTGSKGSLLGGLTGALLMGTAYFLMQASEMKDRGDALAFGSALLFASVFGIRLAATRKIIPAAPLLGLSIAALAVFVSAYVQDRL